MQIPPFNSGLLCANSTCHAVPHLKCGLSFSVHFRVNCRLAMVVTTHWETSQRPLFVRTVWQDGHHHVVLHEEPRRRCSSSKRSARSESPERAVSFKVPTVKLLLAGLRKRKPKSPPRRDIRKPFGTDRGNDAGSVAATTPPPPFSYDNYWNDQFDDTLSRRVLMWLDLAVQSRGKFKGFDLKKRESVKEEKVVAVVEEPVLTSEMEYEDVAQVQEEVKLRVRSHTAKRQLHIFLPCVAKKTSDSESFLSSKASSLIPV